MDMHACVRKFMVPVFMPVKVVTNNTFNNSANTIKPHLLGVCNLYSRHPNWEGHKKIELQK